MPPEAIEKIKEVITLKSVLDYLEEAAFQYPEKEAVYDGSQRYSWQELLEISRKVGSALTRVCRQRSPVPIFMEKRAKTIGAFFGAVYAGCFYVYINPELPLKRIRERLDFLDSDVVVTEGILAERLLEDGFAGRALRFEELVEEEVDMKVLGFYRLQMRPEDYLYGMFTSGSTGAPKLVTVSGGALVEFAEDMILVKI
jgi:acyl-coenzyme A synthetase/AMP-(fatty) acid ligase